MKTFICTTAIALMMASPALAANGGQSIISKSISSSHAAASSSSYSQGGRGGQGGAGGQGGQGGNASANNAGNNQSTSFKDRLQAPGIGGAGLTSSGECPIGSFSLGGSGPGFGALFGMTTGDKPCRDLYLIKQAWGRHDRVGQISQQYLVNEVPAIRKAFSGK